MSLSVVSIFLAILCPKVPSTDVARAREIIVLWSPCSAAQLLCIHSPRDQRVLFQSYRSQKSKPLHPVILACALTFHLFPPQWLPRVPKLSIAGGQIKPLLISKQTQEFDKCQLLYSDLWFSHLYPQTSKHPSCPISTLGHKPEPCCQTF